MNGYLKLSTWFLALAITQLVKTQIDDGFKYKEEISTFEIGDGEILYLDDDFCLKSITVKAYLTNETFDSEIKPSLRLDIIWESDHNVTSLDMESDSFNDSYCDASDRFRYQRKPIKKHMHTFPDIVNNGARFVPIKLDCKYIIAPEMPYPCSPMRLKYATPVCLSESVCSCRNASLPSPELTVEKQSEGVVVRWRSGENGNVDEIRMIHISVQLAQVSLPFNPEQAQAKEFSTGVWENTLTRSGRRYFRLNSTFTREYVVRALYENSFACSGNSTQIYFHFPEPESNAGETVAAYPIFYMSVVLILLLGVIATFLCCRKKQFGPCKKGLCREPRASIPTGNNNEDKYPFRGFEKLFSVTNPDYAPAENDEDIIDFKLLRKEKKLSEGQFGVVYLASSSVEIKGYKLFAIKQLKDSAAYMDTDFYEEINIFRKAGSHPNVIFMIGYCENPLTIVMEYMESDLLNYLKKLRDKFELDKSLKSKSCAENGRLPPGYITANEVENTPLKAADDEEELEPALGSQELESFALQIARGMAHLEQRDIVHRDLAARNVLIDGSKILKITDFGMSRAGIYVARKTKKLPLRWTAPECIIDRIFSTKSDVWSFAVVLWEIGTLGGFPYSHLSDSEVQARIKKGGHPDKPEIVTEALFNLMLRCWSFDPNDRPSFVEIVRMIENLRREAYVDFGSLSKLPPTSEEVNRS